MKPVLIHSRAQAELGEAVGYYESQKQALGLDFQTEVERAIARVQQAPQIGSPYKATDLRRYFVRRNRAHEAKTGLLAKAQNRIGDCWVGARLSNCQI